MKIRSNNLICRKVNKFFVSSTNFVQDQRRVC